MPAFNTSEQSYQSADRSEDHQEATLFRQRCVERAGSIRLSYAGVHSVTSAPRYHLDGRSGMLSMMGRG
jgi:hypothetical protein